MKSVILNYKGFTVKTVRILEDSVLHYLASFSIWWVAESKTLCFVKSNESVAMSVLYQRNKLEI